MPRDFCSRSVPALGIAAGVDVRACAALARAGVALRYALVRGSVEGPAAPLGPGRAREP